MSSEHFVCKSKPNLRLLVFRALSYVVRKLFLSHDNRIVFKPRELLIALLLVSTTVLALVLLLTGRSPEYDLMLDVATSQNISNGNIVCKNKKINDLFSENRKFMDTYFLKVTGSMKRQAVIEHKYSSIDYSLNITDRNNEAE